MGVSFSGNMACLAYCEKSATRLCQHRKQRIGNLRGFEAPQPAGRLTISCQDCFSALESSPGDALLFLDPPYLDRALGTTKSTRQYSCGPNWGISEHRQLRQSLTHHERWILCHEDMPEIRTMYEGYRILTYAQSTGQASTQQ